MTHNIKTKIKTPFILSAKTTTSNWKDSILVAMAIGHYHSMNTMNVTKCDSREIN
jgi:hypothetical protein